MKTPGVGPGEKRVSGGRTEPEFNVVAIDYGIKAQHPAAGWPAKAAKDHRWCRRRRRPKDILAMKPDGVFLSKRSRGIPPETGKICSAGDFQQVN